MEVKPRVGEPPTDPDPEPRGPRGLGGRYFSPSMTGSREADRWLQGGGREGKGKEMRWEGGREREGKEGG